MCLVPLCSLFFISFKIQFSLAAMPNAGWADGLSIAGLSLDGISIPFVTFMILNIAIQF
jgi:hypothetical protein